MSESSGMEPAETTSYDTTSAGGNWTEEEKREMLEQLSYDTFIALRPTVLFVVTLILVGIPGNLLVIFVYLKQFKPSATRVFVVALAVCDLAINAFTLPRHVTLMPFSYLARGVHYCRVVGTLAVCPIVMSYWLLVCVALDRRRRICWPSHRQLSSRQAVYVLLGPGALTAFIGVTFTALQEESPLQTGVPGLTGTTCSFPNNYYGMDIRKAYRLSLTVSYAIVLPLLAFSYAQILGKVYQTRARRLLRWHRTADPHQEQPTHHGCRVLGQTNLGTSADMARATVNIDTHSSDSPGEGSGDESNERSERFEAFDDHNASDLSRESGQKGGEIWVYPHDSQTNREKKQEEISISDLHNSPTNLFGAKRVREMREASRDCSVTSASSSDKSRTKAHATQTTSGDVSISDFCTAQSSVPSLDVKGQGCDHAKAGPGDHFRSAPRSQQRKWFLSRTTLMMFVLTVVTMICCVPYFVVEFTQTQYVGADLSPGIINMRFLARCFPSVNSVINPFVYCFCNADFRLKCCRFLAKLRRNVLPHT